MKGKLLILLLAVLLLLTACGKTRTIACDGCGKQQEIKASSNMDDSWIIYCRECEDQLMDKNGAEAGN